MAIDFSFYGKVNGSSRAIDKQHRISDIQQNANDMFDDGLVSGFEVKMGTFLKEKAVLNFETEIECLIEFERMKEKVYNSNSRSIKTYPNTINTGDYVTHSYSYNENKGQRTYIIRSMVDRKRGYDHSFMIICQQELKFLDKEGNIVSFPCNFNDSRSRMVESYEKSALVDDASTFECYIQDNEHTRMICTSDESGYGQISRFIIKGRAYKVTGIDDITMNGLITIRMKIDKVSPQDNLELGIADYHKLVNEEQVPEEGVEFMITGENEVLLGDGDYTYTINADEQYYKVAWSINDITGVHLFVDQNDSVRIRVDNNIKLKGKEIVLKATIDNVEYTKEIKIVNW